jgi:hypothetical protein
MEEQEFYRTKIEILNDKLTGDVTHIAERIDLQLKALGQVEERLQASTKDAVSIMIGTIGSITSTLTQLREKALATTEQQIKVAHDTAVANVQEQAKAIVLEQVALAARQSFSGQAKSLNDSVNIFSGIVDGYSKTLDAFSKENARHWLKKIAELFIVCCFSMLIGLTLFRIVETRFPIFDARARESLYLGRQIERIWQDLNPKTKAEIDQLIKTK